MTYEYGFIGTGNMGSALASAVVKKIAANDVAMYDYDPIKAKALADALGATAVDGETLGKSSNYVVLGVKPQVLEAALTPLQGAFAENPDPVFVTMAAGTKMATVAALLGGDYPIIRIMPNTPVSVGAGTLLVARNDKVTEAQFEKFLSDFSEAGVIVPMEESQIEAAACLSGCGPAFVFQYIEALAKAGVALGMDYDTAATLAKSTVRGSALLSELSDESLETLRVRVCSPGGTTIEGVNSFVESDLDGVVAKAIRASYDRTLELLGE